MIVDDDYRALSSMKCRTVPDVINPKNGPLDFYNGTLSKLVLKDLEEHGSLIKHGDLITYQADVGGGEAYTIDAREVSPYSASENMFSGLPKEASYTSPLAIAVPGELMGYYQAHKKFASMTWKELIEPTIKLCQDGITMTSHMRAALERFYVKKSPILMKMFYNNETAEFHKTISFQFSTDLFQGKCGKMLKGNRNPKVNEGPLLVKRHRCA
uniref:Uncharacterized protein n=1 Tax=Megaselia scalaris TaxID=36166 RepID=T1GQB8_MEGSC